jgi:hypothetical protein
VPQNIAVAAFVLGAVLILLALSSGGFKLFGAEMSGASGHVPRAIAGVLGVLLIGFGLWEATREVQSGPSSEPVRAPVADGNAKPIAPVVPVSSAQTRSPSAAGSTDSTNISPPGSETAAPEAPKPDAIASVRDYTCNPGYVWRVAKHDDLVCVTPHSRDVVRGENEGAASFWVNGAYGPHTCASGRVWREAYSGDDVCVSTKRHDEVRQENAEARLHRVAGA